MDDAQCEVCQAAEETAAHIIFECNNARQFWNALGIQTEANWPIEAIKEIQAPESHPGKILHNLSAAGLRAHMEKKK